MGILWSRVLRVAFLLGVVGSLASCDGSQGAAGDGVGSARVALVSIPAGVTCVRVFATGATRFAFADRDVKTGDDATLFMGGLPVGNDVFTGFGLPGACAATADDEATWVSDGVTATVNSERGVDVTLPMHPNGLALVSVDFQSDDPNAPDGGIANDPGSTAAGADAGCDH